MEKSFDDKILENPNTNKKQIRKSISLKKNKTKNENINSNKYR